MKPYYYVYRHGHRGPEIKHPSVIAAQKESIRLAEQHPESTFEILKCVGHTRTTKAKTFWLDGEEPEELSRPIGDSCRGFLDNSESPTEKFQRYNGRGGQ